MKIEFTTCTLLDIALNEKGSIISGPFGSNISSKYFQDTGVPVIRGNNLSIGSIKFKDEGFAFLTEEKADELNAYAVKGDLIFTAAGTIGQVGLIEEKAKFKKYVISNKQLRVRLDIVKVNPLYAYYWFSSPWIVKDIINKNTGSTVPLINLGIIKGLEIRIPKERRAQDRIAKVLSNLDSKIELNNKINAELEAMAKLIYDYWFVQFDFPNAKGKPYKTSGGKMVWSEELKREIPKDWQAVKMSEWIDIDKSGDWGKEEPEGNFTTKVTCIRGADINGLNGLDKLKPPTRYISEKNSFKILKSHDIVIEISGGSPTQSTGRLAFITDETINRFENPLICSNFCKPISMKNDKLLYNFVYNWNRLYDNGVFFGYEGKTSGIKNLLLDSFVNSHYSVIPDGKTVERFYNFMENIQKKKQTALAESQKLSELRDWLLPMLMNGQVKVGDVEEELLMAAEPSSRYELLPSKVKIDDNKKAFAKQVLGGKIVSLFKDDPNFTHIKFQKLQYLAEHLAEVDLNWNYYRQSAGPYDPKFMHSVALKLKASKWFEERKYRFYPLEKVDKIEGYYDGYFKPINSKLNSLFTSLKNSTEDEAEIIATLYAVWNNMIIKKEEITDEIIVSTFFEWSDRKKKYTKQQVATSLAWIKKEGFVPTGFGRIIKEKKNNT